MEPRQIRNIVIAALLFVLLLGSRTIAKFLIEYHWWRELGQTDTWFRMLSFQVLPSLIASTLAWFLLVWAYRRGMHFAGVPSASYRLYSRLIMAGLAVISVAFIGSGVDSAVLITYVGSLDTAAATATWLDPVFGNDISFYFFDLPLYKQLLQFVLVSSLFAAVVFWASARGWQLFDRIRQFTAAGGKMEEFDPGPTPLLLPGASSASFLRIIAVIVLVSGALGYFLGQYDLLLNAHNFMTGMDWVDEKVVLPLRYLTVLALLAAIPLVWTQRFKFAAIGVVGAFILTTALPGLVRSGYVRPNELTIETPYIQRHLDATVSAYGLDRGTERPFDAASDSIDMNAHATLIDNIRLWDTGAFTRTITQIQALRPYYEFADIDIDRYTIDGKIKQVLLSPREINISRLPQDAQASWINSHLSYTHGYGVVMSEVNRTTEDGLPVLMIQDAPPDVRTPDIQLNRPSIYYGEVTHEPVFVNTDQKEFDYPADDSGEGNVTSNYQGTGGFPIHSLPMRLAAALTEGDINILLTGQTNENSRMMIYRNVTARLQHLASFVQWDPDPYLVITDDGSLVWIVDGYTASASHPYSAATRGGFNYIRNSVKATIDAYSGETKLYIFDEADPIIQAYAAEFPNLFTNRTEMPADLRAHVRYPLAMFSIQAELYRSFHMKDPEVFYNKEDLWDVGQSLAGQSGSAAPMTPTYIVATLPGETEPEFILMLPFTPRGKDNLIGWMAARCDGDKLGELVYFQLSKQQLVFGPNQIESRINQDQNIAKDLTLWNQQGSSVIRGDILALPVGDSFLYVESIYIQAESARMPQLKKVVLAMGNRLIYEDTFERALFRLGAGSTLPPLPLLTEAGEPQAQPPGTISDSEGRSMREVAERLSALRRLAEELSRELQSIESELNR
ncbi:MAG: UPF0182 family protein [Acidobacteria bacterium]|nr:UPF0182 family protein [Acidobacteriota bacterium]MDA1235087.1 UPF0182 family protein [Acidobacteriota bacterium]